MLHSPAYAHDVHFVTLRKAVRESNRIEGEPTEGVSYEGHLLAAELALIAAEDDLPISPRMLHYAAFHSLYSHAGVYRRVDVYVNLLDGGQHRFPPYDDIPSLMRAWLHTYKKMSPWAAHVAFESIHPFQDGNGRIGRCILWAMQHREGEEITPILYDEREAYYDKLQEGR